VDSVALSVESRPFDRDRVIDQICDQFVDDYAAADPVMATYLGLIEHDAEVTDLSLDGFAQRVELIRHAAEAVATAAPVDERERSAQASFVERGNLELELYEAHVTQSAIGVASSPAHALRDSLDLVDTTTDAGWANLDRRLAALPQAFADYQRTLAAEAADGHVTSRPQLQKVARQLRRWAGVDNTDAGTGDVFSRLVDNASVDESMQSDLERHARQAAAATAELADFLERLSADAPAKEAVGRERYALASRYFLGARVDLDETYAWGWEELSRIADDMRDVAQQVVPGGSVADAVHTLDADPHRKIEGRDRLQAWMQGLSDRAVSDLADTHFDIPEPIRRLECRLATNGDGSIYYTGPSEDFTRPGRMWWDVPRGIDTFSTWREVTTIYHEGVPGHHLQVAQTALRSDLLNRWQRLMCWVSGHGEGWALYAERLMDDLGYLDDPGDKLGMLDAQGFRAARVIVDIGMHLELEIPRDNPFGFHPGERWTPELGLEFMRQHSFLEDAFLRQEIDRYLGWPGQAPSYKVGERIWLQARADAESRQRDAFDLTTFHRQALDLGSIGLDPLREALAHL
jgi:uncharacterized protein (DUF885 family)